MSAPSLTAEQIKRMEENKRKAMAKLSQKKQTIPQCEPSTHNSNPRSNNNFISSHSTGNRVPVVQTFNKPTASVVGYNSSHNAGDYAMTSNRDTSNVTQPSTDSAKQSQALLDRIKENKLKALARRAEKQSKSPIKVQQNSTSPNKEGPAWLSTVNKSGSARTGTGPAVAGQINRQNDSVVSNLQGLQKGSNIFSSFKGKPVKGDCVLVSRERFEVKSGYSAPLMQVIKLMNTKLYDAVTKRWTIALSEYNRFMTDVVTLKPAVEVEPLPRAIQTVFANQIRGVNPPTDIPIADLSRIEPTIVNSLMSFQREGVDFGVHKNGRVLFGDDMGLGKTIQAICLSRYYKDEWPVLVVVPSSVRFDWSQQFQRWIPTLDPASVNVVVTGKDDCTCGLINIISYDLMARKAETLKRKRFKVIIMDECHLLKNYKTARYKAALPLLQQAKRVILLSGTPALSRPSELYTQISSVCPFLFKFHDFGVRYCEGKHHQWGWDYSGFSNMEELQILLAEQIMIRRLKKDVLKELPDKIRQMILLDPSTIKVSKALTSASKVMSSANLKKKDEQGALLDFFHKSGAAKIKAIKAYLEDILEGEKKFLIFAHHGDILDGIEETVQHKIKDNYIRIDGRTNSEQRNFLCKKFQHNSDIRVAILSITAANAGLNLSSANLVIFAELFWNPGILVQAEDRAHRIGQQDSVCVQYLVATGTSDDHIWPMIQRKLDVLGKAGLTKDNFSAAETTKLSDQRQEEITKFLDESFNISACDLDMSTASDMADDDDAHFATTAKSPSKALKQKSILAYTSPTKDSETNSPNTTPPCTPPTAPKGQGHTKNNTSKWKVPGPSKTKRSNLYSTVGQGQSEMSSKGQGQSEMGSKGQGQSEISFKGDVLSNMLIKGQGCSEIPCKGPIDNDLEEFLMDSDSEWDEGIAEPATKKMKK